MYLLEQKYAESVFGFIFTFTENEDEVLDAQPFDSFILELFCGYRLSDEVSQRLFSIYNSAIDSDLDLESRTIDLLADVKQSVNRTEILLSIFRLLLKYSCEDGMISQRDSNKLSLIYKAFDFSEEELLSLSDEEREVVIRLVLNSSKYEYKKSQSLEQQYEILQSLPDDSDQTLRKNYRRLAMDCHPDRHSYNESSDKFIKIQSAYEEVMRNRKFRASS